MTNFSNCFRDLTGHTPFYWQEQLYERLMKGDLPDACDIPTGLGKTNVMAVWLIALADQIGHPERTLPLRLVYVVDRRVIVDQATTEAEELIERLVKVRESESGPIRRIADRLAESSLAGRESVVALSTLRGQMADNRKWCLDPSQPAIIVGTVDMIGSRILFSGYGKVGLNHRSLQAGLLGQDSLIVIDEAHLSPCFVDTQADIRQYVDQYRSIRPFHVMSLSATLTNRGQILGLDEARECQNLIAAKRLNASKTLEMIKYNLLDASSTEKPLSPKEVQRELVEKMVARALEYEDYPPEAPAKSIIIFASTVRLVNEITSQLRATIVEREVAKREASDSKMRRKIEEETDNRILKLTGEMRGQERDRLVKTDKFKSFDPNRQRDLLGATRYLIATSCAEVGVNLDADHGICDLSTLDSMIQRIGRINRFGDVTSTVTVMVDESALTATQSDQELIRQLESEVDKLQLSIAADQSSGKIVKTWKSQLADTEEKLKSIRKGKDKFLEYKKVERASPEKLQTWNALKSLAAGDLSPLSLRGLIKTYPGAIPAPPVRPPLEPARVDDWSMTSLKQTEYPRPLVHYWLRGVIDDEQAETTFVWREELNHARSLHESGAARLLDMTTTVPAQPRERATLTTVRAEEIIRALAKKNSQQHLVIINPGGDAQLLPLDELPEKKLLFSMIAYRTIVLPALIGGLDPDGNPEAKGQHSSDVLDPHTWSRYLIWRDEAGRYSVRSLLGGDDPVSVGNLPATIKHLSQGGILVNRQQIEDLYAADDESCWVTVGFVHHPPKDQKGIDEPENDETSLGLAPRSVLAHDQDVERYAREICRHLGLSNDLTDMIAAAGYRHDLGKAREWWQKAVGNFEGWQSNPIAKSNSRSFDHSLNQGYRHEFGSLLESQEDESLVPLADRDLILHLIASHHGYGRPHFPERAFDRHQPLPVNRAAALESIHRFDRLQKRYGWWQLAYLEAILKAADAMASRDYSKGTIGGEE